MLLLLLLLLPPSIHGYISELLGTGQNGTPSLPTGRLLPLYTLHLRVRANGLASQTETCRARRLQTSWRDVRDVLAE